MAKKRVARLNEQLKRELIALLQFEVRDPRIGLITVTDVEVTPDLYHAKVFFAVHGGEEEQKSALEGLRAAAGFLRSEIGKRMHIRHTPELHFTHDNTLEHAMHIERLLREVREDSAAQRDPAAADSARDADIDDDGDDDGGDATDDGAAGNAKNDDS
jgi:ribosome-binding factor A